MKGMVQWWTKIDETFTFSVEDNTVTLTILALYYTYTCTCTTTKILLYYVHTFTTVQIKCSPTGSQRSNQHNKCIVLHAPIQPRIFSGSCGQASMGRTLTIHTSPFYLTYIYMTLYMHPITHTYSSHPIPPLSSLTHTHTLHGCVLGSPLFFLTHTYIHTCTLHVSVLSHTHTCTHICPITQHVH